jgi:hypothetical protein
MGLKCGASENLETRDTADNFTVLLGTETEKRNSGNPKRKMAIVRMRFVSDITKK